MVTCSVDAPMMRIAFLGQTGPFAPAAFHRLMAFQHNEGRGVFEIVLCVEGRKHPIGRKTYRLFPPKRAPIPVTDRLSSLSSAYGVPCLITCDINTKGCIDEIRKAGVDRLVCIGFDRLFTLELLECTTQGAINAHPSMLPKWRGPSPIFWALRTGATTGGVSLHEIDPYEDHGILYSQQAFPFFPKQSGTELYEAAGALAGDLLIKTLTRASQGPLTGITQNHALATRAPRPSPEDAYFEATSWRCEPLLNFVSGAPFFKAAWTRLGDDPFFIRRGIDWRANQRIPGQYLLCHDKLLVQCQDGVAELEIQV